MTREFNVELARFRDIPFILGTRSNYQITRICEDGFMIAPSATKTKGRRPYSLTFLGVIHGNETAGVAVLNEVVRMLALQPEFLNFSLALIIGNPDAGEKNIRFIERDLNRSFGGRASTTREEKRAQELEKILAQTEYLVDFHQTKEKAEHPFFIFPYTRQGFEFAHAIDTRIPIVTHWGDPFSEEGRCTDEYTNSMGGVGITIELGQNGLDEYQIAAGFRVATMAMAAVRRSFEGVAMSTMTSPTDAKNIETYTWAQVLPFPASQDAFLEPGWYNFKQVDKGALLGAIDGKKIYAEVSGKVLFPQYPKRTDPRLPTELCRIMRRVEAHELPHE